MKPVSLEIKGASYLSALILLVVLWGFYRTYFMFFPGFENFVGIQHFHGIMMLLWMGCLIIQPLLIQFRKMTVHKALGKLSFVIAPLLVVSILLVSRMGYMRGLAAGGTEGRRLLPGSH